MGLTGSIFRIFAIAITPVCKNIVRITTKSKKKSFDQNHRQETIVWLGISAGRLKFLIPVASLLPFVFYKIFFDCQT